jgi:hypothetical protein
MKLFRSLGFLPGLANGGREDAVDYTRDGIMAQIYVAFGQGTGTVRVSQDVCAALRKRYYRRIDKAVLKDWETLAMQVLERFRALGRLMALNAVMAGKTNLAGADVESAAQLIERQSQTPLCPPN